MFSATRLLLTLTVAVSAGFALAEESREPKLTPDELKFFESKIRPVLIRECYGCHSNKAGNVRGGLRMDTKQLMLIGGSTGPAIVPGKPDESWLFDAITHESFEMPPKRKLPANVIADFKKWIEMGAPDPRVSSLTRIKPTITKGDIQQAKESFWSYQKPTLTKPQPVEDLDWSRTQIDRYILSRMEQASLKPAQDAEAWKVIRRLSFDLVGLPPTPAEISRFTIAWKRNPDEAVAEVVDRLFASPQYGERWGRHWLDVARYAESTGTAVNMTYPQAWRYRDYVVDSFNQDKPYNRFVQEQLAGDLLPVKTDEQWAENLIATTFLAIGPKDVNEDNRVQFAANLADEQIDATTRVFLGMSVSCARCHDHKFDPIPQTDYYAMAGIFKNTLTFFGHPQSAEYGSYSGAQEKQTSSLLILPVNDPNPFDRSLTPAQRAEIKQKMEATRQQFMGQRSRGNARGLASFRATMAGLSGALASVDVDGKPHSWTMGVQDSEELKETHLLVRGEIAEPAQVVPRGFPQVLTTSPVRIKSQSSGRLELARWIASPDNPLTARVMVNRIWQHLLGHGIVRSTENFGATGQLPSHPDLLDYLALRFVESGWSVKSLIREIATSRVYRMQSAWSESSHRLDPDNKLLWRANPRRLDAEALRDAMLRISGELDLKRPRASVVAEVGFTRVRNGTLSSPATRAMQSGFGPRRRPGRRSPSGADNPLSGEKAKFRSVYLPIVREEEPRSLQVFDFADPSAVTGTREQSNNANQALYMLNNPFVLQQSHAFAVRLSRSTSRTAKQVDEAFLMTFGRPPTSTERRAVETFLQSAPVTGGIRDKKQAALALLCQSLFASAEFRFLD